jgi:hypothetical protein
MEHARVIKWTEPQTKKIALAIHKCACYALAPIISPMDYLSLLENLVSP